MWIYIHIGNTTEAKSLTTFYRSNFFGHSLPLRVFFFFFFPLISSEQRVFCLETLPLSSGRCFLFNVEEWGQECRGVGSAKGWGEAHKKLLVCAAMPNCSPRISTMVNYGEIWETREEPAAQKQTWWDDTAAGLISQIGEEGHIWRNRRTTSRHLLRREKLDLTKH